MTVATLPPRHPSPHFDAALAALRARGLRASSARRLVLGVLLAAGRPLRAEEIAGGLDGALPACDVGSVYRNLETLEAAGLVRHVHAGHGPGRYALAGPRETEYLACEDCGELQAVPAAELDAARAMIRARLGFQARFTHFPLAGTCAACARVADPVPAAR